MYLLIINAGSSSLKVRLYERSGLRERAHESIDKIGLSRFGSTRSHKAALKKILKILQKNKVVNSPQEITHIGHRIVHGGEKYTAPTPITPKVLNELHALNPLAPLHNPHNLAAIQACMKLLPHAVNIGVFDTAFHQTMPESAYLYALPRELYTRHKIRRYGFHGISHHYVSEETSKILKKRPSRLITCHLGNGSSITAIKEGKSIDTSMGFTPLEGVPMGTRSGSIDPGIILHLQETLGIPLPHIKEMLYHESGLKGISGISSDMRHIYEKYKKKDPRALSTMNLLAYQIAKTCGGFAAALGGLDALTFTGGMGIHAFYLRALICSHLAHLGLSLSTPKNRANRTIISTPSSKVTVLLIKTNEELEIAHELDNLCQAAPGRGIRRLAPKRR